MLKQPARIFQIIGKQIISDKVIRLFLDDVLNYLDGDFNLIHCANSSPYNKNFDKKLEYLLKTPPLKLKDLKEQLRREREELAEKQIKKQIQPYPREEKHL
ncbi:8800_t:CDS:2 [Funneliformis geosporum]|nr:8800_t:CDS:2 [Funneliformis geosporum]